MVLQEYKDYFTDVYETDDLTVAVCNAEANRAQLSDMPHEQWEDLALYYGVRVPLIVNKNGVVAIHNSQLETWGISKEQLKKDAWENMEKEYPAVLCTMDNVVCGKYDSISLETEAEGTEESLADDTMFVLSNAGDIQGAAYMFDKRLMEKTAAKLDSNLVILPCSVDEIIIMRETEGMDMESMKDMVREANETAVKTEKRLSNEVYHYNRESQMLSMVKSAQPEQDLLPDRSAGEEAQNYDCDGQNGYGMSGMMQQL